MRSARGRQGADWGPVVACSGACQQVLCPGEAAFFGGRQGFAAKQTWRRSEPGEANAAPR
eukprot:965052-Lingulodinium_polyedra.AAC.1